MVLVKTVSGDLVLETALDTRRNIVRLMLDGFEFGPSDQLGTLEALRHYNGPRVPVDYFSEAMGRLREKFLNVPLDVDNRSSQQKEAPLLLLTGGL